ncbi:endoribonuclease Dicer-like [Melanaphis sacchari]|uniref:endoribonuclease Dicer-like n=1 Tax=Melanaphis sacchari TaxID=742174 RepID=UPI000DC12DAA|nr:endoribonuclease Dicer-like [Melanaphis sacchari]
MNQPPQGTSSINPRNNKIELLDRMKKSNTILYLPSGIGKIYIATTLIKYFGGCLTKQMGKGRKWTFYIVRSETILSQQADKLRSHLQYIIGTIGADVNTNRWSSETWNLILEKCHILVITGQAYINNLNQGYMNINDANLLIFDECHLAVALHPFQQIMQVYDNASLKSDERPHILGITATLINKNTTNVKDELINLQNTFNSQIVSKLNENIQVFSARPKEHISLYDEFILDDELKAIIIRVSKIIKHLEYSQSSANLIDGGPYMTYIATWYFIIDVEKQKKICNDKDKCMMLFILNNVSLKVKQLMQHLSSLKVTDSCLVLVDQQKTAKYLNNYIKEYTQEYNLNNILSDFMDEAKDQNEIKYKRRRNIGVIKKFNENTINVLITSENIEDIDIYASNVVITFDFPKNFFSYRESKGRARSSDGKFIIMVPNKLDIHKTHFEFILMEEEFKKFLEEID